MSKYRHTYINTFSPSAYSKGIEPVSPYDEHAQGRMQGWEYGGPFDLAVSAYRLAHPDEDEKPSFLSQYWWTLLIAVPFLYVGLNMALDSARPSQEKK